MMRAAALPFLLILAQAQEEPVVFIEEADYELAEAAVTRKGQFCGSDYISITDDEKSARKDSLLAWSGDSFLLKVMKSAKTEADFQTEFEANFSPGMLVGNAGPLAFAIVLLVIYFICCWTACPCCFFCRVGKQERQVARMHKFVLGAGFVVCLLGMVVSAILAVNGSGDVLKGLDQFGCESATLVDTTMSGQESPAFNGLINTLETFQELSDSLQEGSSFIQDIRTAVSNTAPISDALILASGTMGLLIDMMNNQANLDPKDTDGTTSLKHSCTLCTPLSEALTAARDALEGGVGSALEGARAEVDAQLSGENLVNLAGSMTSASAPLTQFKDTMHQAFGMFVTSDALVSAQQQISSLGTLGSVVLVMGGFGIVACALATLAVWLRVDDTDDEEQKQTYRVYTHRCACCTWCTAFYFTIFAFIVGGIFTGLMLPLSSMCLVFEDVDSQMLEEISGAVGLNMSDPSFGMMADMVDQCFQGRKKDDTGSWVTVENPAMLKLITINEDVNGTMQTLTMYEKIVDQTKEQINGQFAQITSSMGGGNSAPLLNTDPNVVKLKNLLGATDIAGMMLLSDSEQSYFAPSTSNPTGGVGPDLATYVASNAMCADFTVPTGFDLPAQGSVIPGVTAFSDALNTKSLGGWGVPKASLSCAKGVVCGGGAPDACNKAEELMTLKHSLRTVNTFKCKRFKVGVAACDVKDMVDNGDGTYSGDCLVSGTDADGNAIKKVETEEYDCGLDEFSQLVKDFQTRLNKVFARMDSATDVAMNGINVNLKALVDENVIAPLTQVAEGLTCGFLKESYHGVLEGLCYNMVFGMKMVSDGYVVCASMAFLMIPLVYIMWRIAIDNATKEQWNTAVNPYEADETSLRAAAAGGD